MKKLNNIHHFGSLNSSATDFYTPPSQGDGGVKLNTGPVEGFRSNPCSNDKHALCHSAKCTCPCHNVLTRQKGSRHVNG